MARIIIRDRNKNKPDKKPSWEYRFEAAKVDGKRKHISKAGFKTKKAAEEAGAKAYAEYNNAGLHFEPKEISVADYLDYWMEMYCKPNLKYHTQELYRGIIENHIKPRFGEYKLKSLTPAVLQAYVNELKTRYSKSHVTGIFTIISGSLDYAIEPLGYLKDNPARFVKIGKMDKEPRQRLTLDDEEWQAIMNQFPFGNRFHLMLMIGAYTGLRISETCALTWDDIDLEKRTISVNKITVKRNVDGAIKGAWYFGTPKTKKSTRTVLFGDTLYNLLIKEKARQEANEQEYGEYYTIHVLQNEIDEKGKTIQRIIPIKKLATTANPRVNLINVHENGEFTSQDTFKYASRIIRLELMIPFDYHSLRHTHATKLIENGANVKAVQERLGHEKIETTLQTYVHNTSEMAKQSVEIFETHFSSVSTPK